MAEIKICVLRAAGVNCNEETAYAFELAGASPQQIHVNRLLESPQILDDFAGLVVPGGFSYGDDVSAGKVLALELETRLGEACQRLLERDGLVLGICNGFQVLIKSGLLPSQRDDGKPIRATLGDNASNRYEDRWVRLAVNSKRSRFFREDDSFEVPVAHAEGRFIVGRRSELQDLEAEDRVVLRYIAEDGGVAAYPDNPNGSIGGVAGICDSSGQVLGLMPHPERFLFPYQHPKWTRAPLREEGDGLRIFRNAVEALRA